MTDQQQLCQFDFTDSHHTVIVCKVHGEREVLRPTARNATLQELANTGRWGGPALSLPVADSSPHLVTVPVDEAPRSLTPSGAPSYDLVEYHTPDGQAVSLSVSLFRAMLCPEANDT